MANPKILLIDDDDTLRRLFAMVLRHRTMDVVEAGDGMEGLEKIGAEAFDLMIVDVMMPMLDGIRFLSIIRSRGIQTPVLVLTSVDRAGSEQEMRDAGATDVAIKPLGHTDLVQRVSALLENSNPAS